RIICASAPSEGGIIYSIGFKDASERLALTAAALAAGEYDSALQKQWLNYCQSVISGAAKGSLGYEDYTHYHLAQAVYILGDRGYEKLFPESKPDERLVWSTYRTTLFDYLLTCQAEDGSFRMGSANMGPVYHTACCLAIMKLDRGYVPIYRR